MISPALGVKRSIESAWACVPLLVSSAAKLSSASGDRSTRNMKAPSRAACRANSRPIPDAAPVTTIAGLIGFFHVSEPYDCQYWTKMCTNYNDESAKRAATDSAEKIVQDLRL